MLSSRPICEPVTLTSNPEPLTTHALAFILVETGFYLQCFFPAGRITAIRELGTEPGYCCYHCYHWLFYGRFIQPPGEPMLSCFAASA
jgi:hypothetical protein